MTKTKSKQVTMSTGATVTLVRRGEHFARPCYGGVMPAFAPSDGLLFTCHCGGGSTFVGVDEIEQMIATMKGTDHV